MTKFTNINTIPVRTWSWLKVNDIDVDGFDKILEAAPIVETDFSAQDISAWQKPEYYLADEKYNEQLNGYIDRNTNTAFYIHAAKNEQLQPITRRVTIASNGNVIIEKAAIFAEENSVVEVTLVYLGDGQRASKLEILAEKNAKITVNIIQHLSDKSVNVEYVSAHVADDAEVNVLFVENGSATTASNCNIHLKGDRAKSEINSIYTAGGEEVVDTNYRIAHFGKETVGRIYGRGSLNGRSRKVFRGTVDFISGCSGSDGLENESTILLSPKVKNFSVPLLLCGEDDVMGAHAASSGRPDENVMFYLLSRGISEAEAKRILVEAQIAPILDKIADVELKNEILDKVHERIKD